MVKQEFRKIVLCHQLWLKTAKRMKSERTKIVLDINSWLTGSIFADPDHLGEVLSHGEAATC